MRRWQIASEYTISVTEAPSSGESVVVQLVYSSADFTATNNGRVTLASNALSGTLQVTAKAGVTSKTLEHTVTVTDMSSDDQVYETDDPASSITVTVSSGS